MASRPTISLSMILKDEAHCIAATLESARVATHWTILDTGSTDDTKKVALSVEGFAGEGQYHHGPFIDFASARNRALDLETTRKDAAIFALWLSADEILKDGESLLAELQGAGGSIYCIEMRQKIGTDQEIAWMSPRVIRTGSPWRFEGVIHEQVVDRANQRECVLRTGEDSPLRIPGKIAHAASDQLRRQNNAFTRDALLLKEQVNNHNGRAAILLAQLYECVGDIKKAMGLYHEATTSSSSTDEINFARMKYLNCAEILRTMTQPMIFEQLLDLSHDDPRRPETAYMVVHHAALAGHAETAFNLAQEAAKIAAQANRFPGSIPHETTLVWRAHLLAAVIAKGAIGDVATATARSCAEKCVEAGGPVHILEGF